MKKRIRDDIITIVFISGVLAVLAYRFEWGWRSTLGMLAAYVAMRMLITAWWARHPRPTPPARRLAE